MKTQGWILATGGALLFVGGLAVGRLAPREHGERVEQAAHSSKSDAISSRSNGFGGESKVEALTARRASRSHLITELMSEGNVGSRFEILLAQLERSETEDFEVLLREIAERGFNGVMQEERVLIVSAWAKRDPIAAMEYLKEFDQGDRMQFAAMATWASSDPDAAEAWARENHNGKGANDWMVGVVKGLAATDPMRAGALIAEVSKSRKNGERWKAMELTMPYVMERGNEYAKTWLGELGDGGLQSDGAMWMVREMDDVEPEEGARWISSLETKEARREASEVVAARFAREDLAGAQSWVKSLPEDTRTEAAEGVVAVMAKDDPRAAVAWLEKLGDNADYDGAWVDLLQKGFKAEPGVAMVSALRLANEDWRERYTRDYLSRWMKQDEAAAKQWVADYTEYLPPKVAKRFGPKPVQPAQ